MFFKHFLINIEQTPNPKRHDENHTVYPNIISGLIDKLLDPYIEDSYLDSLLYYYVVREWNLFLHNAVICIFDHSLPDSNLLLDYLESNPKNTRPTFESNCHTMIIRRLHGKYF